MRDPKRIDEILRTIGSIWKSYPDMRLMQLLINPLARRDPWLYYVEDDDLIEALKNFTPYGREE